jgi:GNAT superfamily N-acetyltransferase
MHPELKIEQVAYDSELAQQMVDEIQLDLTARYGGPDETPVDPAAFRSPHGAFLLGYADGELIGCAGLRRRSDQVVELKRMYVRLAHRRRGHAKRLLTAVEDRAREMGYRQLVLETGLEQPEAIALYESAGYTAVPPFGYYQDEPNSRSYGKAL